MGVILGIAAQQALSNTFAGVVLLVAHRSTLAITYGYAPGRSAVNLTVSFSRWV